MKEEKKYPPPLRAFEYQKGDKIHIYMEEQLYKDRSKEFKDKYIEPKKIK